MSKKQISNELMKLVKKAQIDEEEGTLLYAFMARREKNEENKKIKTAGFKYPFNAVFHSFICLPL